MTDGHKSLDTQTQPVQSPPTFRVGSAGTEAPEGETVRRGQLRSRGWWARPPVWPGEVSPHHGEQGRKDSWEPPLPGHSPEARAGAETGRGAGASLHVPVVVTMSLKGGESG